MPAFEEQIHSNVVVAYAMDLLDLVQKVRWDLTKYLIVYKLFIKYLSTCDVGVKCMCSSKKSRRGILGIAAAKGTGTTT